MDVFKKYPVYNDCKSKCVKVTVDFKAQPDIYSMREVCGITSIDVKNITQRIYMVDANFMVLISLKSHESINRKLSAGLKL